MPTPSRVAETSSSPGVRRGRRPANAKATAVNDGAGHAARRWSRSGRRSRPAARPSSAIPSVAGSRYRPETTTEAPKPKPVLVGSWANWGKTMNEAYRPAPSRKAASVRGPHAAHPHHRHVDQRVVAAHLDQRSRPRRTTSADARAGRASSAEPQPQTVVWLIASSTAEMPDRHQRGGEPVDPARACGPATRGRSARWRRAASDDHDQRDPEQPVVARGARRSAPESTIPTPPPTPRIAESSPMPPATFSRGNSSRTIAEGEREDAAGHALDDAGDDQHAAASCETAASSVPTAEDEQRPQQQPLLAVHVAEPADDRGADRGRRAGSRSAAR